MQGYAPRGAYGQQQQGVPLSGPHLMQRYAQAQGGANGQIQDYGSQAHQLQGGYGQIQGGYGAAPVQAQAPIAPVPAPAPAPLPIRPVGGFQQTQGFGSGGVDVLEDEIRMMVRNYELWTEKI